MIRINALQLQAGSFHLDISRLEVEEGRYFVLLGPTGSGKTLLLETITGLRRLRQGTIFFGSQNVSSWLPEKRAVGMVPQELFLFPHLSVAQNVCFGLPRNLSPKNRQVRLHEIAALTRIEDLLGRRIRGLSGGEKQRVALARALAPSPKVLLLDEPLSAVDGEAQELLQEMLRSLHRALRPTVLHVTHSIPEAMALGDRIGILQNGRLTQEGSPLEIWRKPATTATARFLANPNLFPAMARQEGSGSIVRLLSGEMLCSEEPTEGQVTAAIRPEEIQLVPREEEEKTGWIPGQVMEIADRGVLLAIKVQTGSLFTVFLTRQQAISMSLHLGLEVLLGIPPSAVHCCPADAERTKINSPQSPSDED